jgi:hypothetical protein
MLKGRDAILTTTRLPLAAIWRAPGMGRPPRMPAAQTLGDGSRGLEWQLK